MNAIMKPFAAIDVPTTIGAPFLDGFFGGIVVEHGDAIAICWPSKAIADLEAEAWSTSFSRIEGADNYTDGHANTVAMAAAGSELAKRVLALNIDASLPPLEIAARDVLEMGYRHFKPTADENYASFRDGDNPSSYPVGYPYTEGSPQQTTVEAFKDGGPEAFEPSAYWASTQYSADNAWVQYFADGSQSSVRKDGQCRFRLVRRLNLGSFLHFAQSLVDLAH